MAHIPKPLPIFGRTTVEDVLEKLCHGVPQKVLAYSLGVTEGNFARALRREQIRRGARNKAELIALYVEAKDRK